MVSFSALSTSLSWISAAIFLGILISILVWVLIHKTQQGLVTDPKADSSRIQPLTKAPLECDPHGSFFYVLSAVQPQCSLSLKPSEVRYRDSSSRDNRTHVFLDLSPSVSSQSRDKWKETIQKVYNHYRDVGSVTFSTSQGKRFKSSIPVRLWTGFLIS